MFNYPTYGSRSAQRLLSLDSYRGLVILIMVFVNYVAGMPDTPALFQHATRPDVITLADLVFPGFLFMAGVAIPYAVRNHLVGGQSPTSVLLHIVQRTAGLLLLGVVLVNDDEYSNVHYSEAYTGLAKPVWYLLFFLTVILFWNAYPPTLRERRPAVVRALRWGSAVMLVVLLAIFRAEGPEGGPRWFATSWWGIPGLIGWGYLFCGLLYLLLYRFAARGVLLALIASLLACTAFYSAVHAGWLESPNTGWLDLPFLFGSLSAAVLAGVATGQAFLMTAEARRRIIFLLAWAGFLLALGSLLRPLQGASKSDGTASYFLLCSGINALGLLTFFVLLDIVGWRRTLDVLRPIGSNALLAYLLPFSGMYLMDAFGWGPVFWPFRQDGGMLGLINALAMTGIIALLVAAAKRWRVVLRL